MTVTELRPASEGIEQGGETLAQLTVLAEGQVKVGGRELTWHAAFPEELGYEGICYFPSGLGATEHTSEAIRRAGAEGGFVTVTWTPARKDGRRGISGVIRRMRDPQEVHGAALQAVAQAVTDNMPTWRRKVPNGDAIDPDRRMYWPHSMGIHAAIRAAKADTSKVDKIIGIGTVGFGNPTPTDLLTLKASLGWAPSFWHEIVPSMIDGNLQLTTENIWKLVVHSGVAPTQTLAEVLSCFLMDARGDSFHLREAGVKMGYLALQHDILVFANEALIGPHFDLYREVPGMGHIATLCKARQLVAEVTDMHQALDDLVLAA